MFPDASRLLVWPYSVSGKIGVDVVSCICDDDPSTTKRNHIMTPYTTDEYVTDEANYLANVFFAMFPRATMVVIDYAVAECIHVTVTANYYHQDKASYLFEASSDDDGYLFSADPSNPIDFLFDVAIPMVHMEFISLELGVTDVSSDQLPTKFTFRR